MSSTHALLAPVADLQIAQRLRDAEEERLRRHARRSAHRRGRRARVWRMTPHPG